MLGTEGGDQIEAGRRPQGIQAMLPRRGQGGGVPQQGEALAAQAGEQIRAGQKSGDAGLYVLGRS